MANFKVFQCNVTVYPHPDADNLELVKAGSYQVVSQKGLYQTGDRVIFIPERAILPDYLAEPFRKYLKGKEQNRVGSIRLRGELSEGILVKTGIVPETISGETDLSEILGITEYEPPIPQQLAGELEPLDFDAAVFKHDCEQYSIYQHNFESGEPVLIFEKLHGSQINIFKDKTGYFSVSSKGLIRKRLCIKENAKNTYWQAIHSRINHTESLAEVLRSLYKWYSVQAIGEVIPVQKGFDYGYKFPVVKLFRLFVNNKEIPYDEIPAPVLDFWCPIIDEIEFDTETVRQIGKNLEDSLLTTNHIAEGIVVSPKIPRRDADGTPLYLKVVSDRFTRVEKNILDIS